MSCTLGYTTPENVLIIGSGAVGAIAALNLEVGGLATITVVQRSNFAAVNSPPTLRRHRAHHQKHTQHPAIPPLPPPPRPHPSHTTLLLPQNGLNIDRPFRAAFLFTPPPSSVSLTGSAKPAPGTIVQDDADRLPIGAFRNPALPASREDAVAREFVALCAAGGKTVRAFSRDVAAGRWRRLVCSACLGPICAVTGLDTGGVRLAAGCVEGLVRLAMEEIVAVAGRKKGVWLGEGVVERTIGVDPLEIYLCPGMLADVRKVAIARGQDAVPMPTLEVLYNLCKAIQWRTKEAKGIVSVPPKRDPVKQ
ncbi:hypothetical protein V2W45_1232152 [Cenococcum geophilum]